MFCIIHNILSSVINFIIMCMYNHIFKTCTMYINIEIIFIFVHIQMAIAINLRKYVIVIALRATKVFRFCKNGWTLTNLLIQANHDQKLPRFTKKLLYNIIINCLYIASY